MSDYGYYWYDNRIKDMFCETENLMESETDSIYATPQAIYDYLDSHIWKQDEAKKAAAMLMWKAQNKIKENVMFVGPSGCGKTKIWRCLQKIFPNQIVITDASNITSDGWKGDKKWGTLLNDPIFRKNSHTVLVLDEADKMLAPKFSSHSENVSHSIQSEGLKMLEGTTVTTSSNNVNYKINTHNISFVLCGAFSFKANELAESNKGMGFGNTSNALKAYDKPLTIQDIIDFGAMPEFMGRIQRLVNLEPMQETDYLRMLLQSSSSPIQSIAQQYGIDIKVSDEKCLELAQNAYKSGLGVRNITSQLMNMVDDRLFTEPDQKYFEF